MVVVRKGVLTHVLDDDVPDSIQKALRGLVSFNPAEPLVEAFVKVAPPREILAEVVCALLAHRLGLPTIEPVLIRVPSNLSPTGADQIAIGSPALPGESYKPWIFQIGWDAVRARIQKWSHLLGAACFDEWIANEDRHFGNVLHDGVSKFWLIDHGKAIPLGLPTNGAVKNTLADVAAEGLEETELQRLQADAVATVERYIQHMVNEVENDVAGIFAIQILQSDMIAWMTERQSHLLLLTTSRIGAKQFDLTVPGDDTDGRSNS